MIHVEIKINYDTIKKIGAVRREAFKGTGYAHQYEVFMIVDTLNKDLKPDVYPVGWLKHRYNAGAVSLTEKMLKLVRQKGMDR